MRHNAMFEGCWAERLFLKYQNIKICVWKWWAEYLKYQNIQIICVLVPAACFKAGECEYLFSNIKAEHLSRFPPRGSHRLTTGHQLTSSHHVLKHQHHHEIKTPLPSCPKLPTPSICQQILQETSTPILSCLPVSFCHIPDFEMFHVYQDQQVANTRLQSNWPTSLSACRL